MCGRSKHIKAVVESLETVNLEQRQRNAIVLRYKLLLQTYNKRVKKYSVSFHSLRLVVTVGSLIVPALLSVQYSDSSTISSSVVSTNVYWIVWVLSLFVTISNGIMTLLKIDKKYFSLHTTYNQLLSEGWQFIQLSGKYDGHKTPSLTVTHQNQYPFFCHSIEKIQMKFVEDEYYKVNEANQTPSADPLVPPTPFNIYGQRNSQQEVNGSRQTVTVRRQNSQTQQEQHRQPLLTIDESPEGSVVDEQPETAVPVPSNVPQSSS